eukprot:TRINITY_DN87503_c0_g1_i1.p1 TRINITY_DN87503_c0_g1~~TRINITY_DN87503_c0_g1_i1.p1  ORF type:complete len:536 (-),score=57.15 TRINITY_DN87503_c0_g1_i1:57-1664(-)
MSRAVLSSGHSPCRKLRFAMSLVSPMACASVLLLCKDIYVLELAANVQLMGIAGTLLAVWATCCQVIVGYVLERNCLTRCFPWDSWGRRAPWYLTHLIAVAFATAAMYMPPSWDPFFLCWWYLAWGVLIAWLTAVLFNIFESSRGEIYPTKEERSEVETACKLAAGIGMVLGVLPQLAVSAHVTQTSLLLAGGGFFLVGLVSLVSVPVLQTARQVFDPSKVSDSFLGECRELLRLPALRHACAYRLLDSLINGLALNGALYYLTFVSGKKAIERSFYVGVLGLASGLATLIAMPFWTIFFRERREHVNPNAVCGRVTALGVFAPVILIVMRSLVPSPWEFVTYFAVLTGTFTGQTYWRANALWWIIDEDCHAEKGRRREALFVGCLSLISSMGTALSSGLLLNSLGLAGLKVINCAQTCLEFTGDAEASCREACDARKVEEQDPWVAICIDVFYLGVIPCIQLLAAYLTCSFPIHGKRLDLIYERQAESFKVVKVVEPTGAAIAPAGGKGMNDEPFGPMSVGARSDDEPRLNIPR